MVKVHSVTLTGDRFSSSTSASSIVSESLPPETATATRSPSRIILNLAIASPTRRRRARSSCSECFTACTFFIISQIALRALESNEANPLADARGSVSEALKPELFAERIHAALDLGVHADHLRPGPR